MTDKEEIFCAFADVEKAIAPLAARGIPVFVLAGIPLTPQTVYLRNPPAMNANNARFLAQTALGLANEQT
jgi:hypothetical protein